MLRSQNRSLFLVPPKQGNSPWWWPTFWNTSYPLLLSGLTYTFCALESAAHVEAALLLFRAGIVTRALHSTLRTVRHEVTVDGTLAWHCWTIQITQSPCKKEYITFRLITFLQVGYKNTNRKEWCSYLNSVWQKQLKLLLFSWSPSWMRKEQWWLWLENDSKNDIKLLTARPQWIVCHYAKSQLCGV